MSLVHDLVKSFIGSEKGRIFLTSYWLPKRISGYVGSLPKIYIKQEYPLGDGFLDVIWHDYKKNWAIAFEIKTGGTPAEFISQIDKYYEHLVARFRNVVIVGVVPEIMINEIRARTPPHLKDKVILLPVEPLSALALKWLLVELKQTYRKHGYSLEWDMYNDVIKELTEIVGEHRATGKTSRYFILDIININVQNSPFSKRAGTALTINKNGEVKRRYLDKASLRLIEEKGCYGVLEVEGIEHKNNYFTVKEVKCLETSTIKEVTKKINPRNFEKRRVVVTNERYGVDVETGLRMYFDSWNWNLLAPKLQNHEVEFLTTEAITQESQYGRKYIKVTGFIPVSIKRKPTLTNSPHKPEEEFRGTALIIDSIEIYETARIEELDEKVSIDLILLGVHGGKYPITLSSITEKIIKQILRHLNEGYIVEVELVKYTGAVTYIPLEIKRVYTIEEYLRSGGHAVKGKARLKRINLPIKIEIGNSLSLDLGVEYHAVEFEGSVILPITRNAKRLVSILKKHGVENITTVVSMLKQHIKLGGKDKIIGIQFSRHDEFQKY